MSGSTAAVGGGIDISKLISSLSPIFLGSGKTTAEQGSQTTTGSATKTIDPGVLAALQGSIGTANANANDPTQTAAIVDNILRQSAQAFAPTIAQQNSSGLYNSSTLSLLSSEARARATAQAAKSVLDFKTAQQQIALQGIGTIAQNTGTTTTNQVAGPRTQTSITAPSSSPLAAIGALGTLLTGAKLLDKVGGIDKIGDLLSQGGDKLAALFAGPPAEGVGAEAGALSGLSEANLQAVTSGFAQSADAAPGELISNLLTTVPGDIGDAAGSAIGGAAGGIGDLVSSLDGAVGGELLGPIGSFVGGALGAGLSGADTGGVIIGGLSGASEGGAGAITNTLDNISNLGGIGPAAGVEALLPGIQLLGGGGEDIFDHIGSFLGGIGDIFGWVVCTELRRQDRMPLRFYRPGQIVYHAYPEYVKRGYHTWGPWLARYIRAHPTSLISRVTESVFNARVENIAARAAVRDSRWTIYGCICEYGIYAAISIPGRFLQLRSLAMRSIDREEKKRGEV